jgi:RNA methyltransferase, TrmH family
VITSRSNPLIKQVHALRQRKSRDETEMFLVEGIHPVGEAIEAGWVIEAILYSPDTLTSNFAKEMLSKVPAKIETVSANIMGSLSEKDNPQGILAVVRKQKSKLIDLNAIRYGLALVSPQDPGNVGTVLRTLDAVKAEALFLLDGGVDPYHPTSVRASMGTLFWLPIIQTTFQEFLDWSRKNAIQLIGSSAHAELDYRKIQADNPWILVLGNEQKGLSTDHIGAFDMTVSLPMRGRASSLNLAVAAGIMLYQFTNQP